MERLRVERLQTRGFFNGGRAGLSQTTVRAIRDIMLAYTSDRWTTEMHQNHTSIEGEVDVFTIVHNGKRTMSWVKQCELHNPRWMAVITALCRRRPILVRAQIHCGNLTTDGPVHTDGDVRTTRLWNVVISFYTGSEKGATRVFPPGVEPEDCVDKQRARVACARSGSFFVMDANVAHQRSAAITRKAGSRRLMLILTFSDGQLPEDVGW